MARLTNAAIRQMNDYQKINYSQEHPAEALRITKISADTATICGKISLNYHMEHFKNKIGGESPSTCSNP